MAMATEEDVLTLSIREAGRLLGISRGLMYEGVHTGQIPHIHIGRRILIPKQALIKLLEGKSDLSNESISRS